MTKNEEKLSSGLERKTILFTCCKRSIVQRSPLRLGPLNGGYTTLFNGLAIYKTGVAILFTNNFTFKVLKQLCDKEGRYIIIGLVVGELTLTICHIYAPNKDDPAFFQNASEQMTSFKCEEIIFGGILTLFWMS